MFSSIFATTAVDNNGYVVALITGILGIVGIVVASVFSRRQSKNNNYIETFAANAQAFQSNMQAFQDRAKNAEDATVQLRKDAETKHAILQDQLDKLEGQMSSVLADRKKERGDYTRMRTVVQKWFAQLQTAWNSTDAMPLPNDDDLDWLGITIEHPPKMVT